MRGPFVHARTTLEQGRLMGLHCVCGTFADTMGDPLRLNTHR